MSLPRPLDTPKSQPAKFAGFLVVGGLGFAVDAGLLWLGLNRFGLTALAARCISFAAAVLTTWILNRSFTFATQRSRGQGSEMILYALATLFSGGINIGVYLVVVAALGREGFHPFLALAAGVGAGLASNFLLYNFVVFRGSAARA